MSDALDGLMVEADVAVRMSIKNPYTRVELLDAASEAPAWIDVLSDSSKAGAQFAREATDRVLQRRGRTARAEELEEELSAKAARLVTGWNLVTLDGTAIVLPFSRGNARDLFKRSGARWLRDQVLEFAADLGNYRATTLPASSPTASTSAGSTDA